MQRQITSEEFFKAVSNHNRDIVLQYLAQIDVSSAEQVEQFVFSDNGAAENALSPLMAAVASGNLDITKIILNFISSSKFVKQKRICLDFDYDDQIRGPLIYAAAAGHEEIVKLLAESGLFELSSKDFAGKTAAIYAEETGHNAIADYLKQQQQTIEARRQISFANWSRLMSTSYGDRADQEVRARLRLAGQPEIKRRTIRKK